MQETRRARLQAVILQELAQLIPREIKDPRVPSLTITRVELTPDAGQATVYVMLMGTIGMPEADRDEKKIRECLQGLASASGYLRRQIAPSLTIRHVPSLVFKEDRGLANATRVFDLLREIKGDAADSADSSSSKDDDKEGPS